MRASGWRAGVALGGLVAVGAALGAPGPAAGQVEVSAQQLLINQRISQAAVVRANTLEALLAGGLPGSFIRDQAFTGTKFGAGITVVGRQPTFTPNLEVPIQPITFPGLPARSGARVSLTRGQLLINQRISQAAVRRSNSLQARLDSGLTGGDLAPGAITAPKLAPDTAIGAVAPTPAPAPSAAPQPSRPVGTPSDVRLSRGQLFINQRISQAAIRRLNEVRETLEQGLTDDELRDGAFTSTSLGPDLATPPPGLVPQNPIPVTGTATTVDGWQVTVLNTTPNANQLILDTSTANDPPAAGRQYFLARVRATRVGLQPDIYSGVQRLRLLGASGVRYDPLQNRCGITPDDSFGGQVFTGTTVEANECWEVLVSDLGTLVLVDDPGFPSEIDQHFAITQ